MRKDIAARVDVQIRDALPPAGTTKLPRLLTLGPHGARPAGRKAENRLGVRGRPWMGVRSLPADLLRVGALVCSTPALESLLPWLAVEGFLVAVRRWRVHSRRGLCAGQGRGGDCSLGLEDWVGVLTCHTEVFFFHFVFWVLVFFSQSKWRKAEGNMVKTKCSLRHPLGISDWPSR